MLFIECVKNIRKCKKLTREEQNWLIKRGFLETAANLPKRIIKLPFLAIGMFFTLLMGAFEWLSDAMDLIQEFFNSIATKIETTVPTVELTKGQIRNIAIKELRENRFYKDL